MTETDAEFLKRMEAMEFSDFILRYSEFKRLRVLARRGAAVPDEPTEAMIEAAKDYASELPMNSEEAADIWTGMLTTALKDTTKGEIYG